MKNKERLNKEIENQEIENQEIDQINPFEEDKTKWVIKSFVRHHGRLTEGQQFAIDNYWAKYGIDFKDEILDFSKFGKFNKVVLELGFGNGDSFIQMAKESPNTLFIGVEVHKPGVGHALMLANNAGLENVKILEDDGVMIIDKMLPDSCIDRFQLFFPDPWHKRKHFKRRIIQAEFCKKLNRILKNKGRIHIATDWEDYARHCIRVMNLLDFLKNTSKDNYVEKPEYRPITKFEKRGLKLGHKISDIIFESFK